MSHLFVYPLHPQRLRSLPGSGVGAGVNSAMGNAMWRKRSQGFSGVADTHSLSGMTNSAALMRYCAGRTRRTSEKMPRDTTSLRASRSWVSGYEG